MAHDAGARCRCVSNHNPNYNELHRHHVWPLGEGGPDIDENLLFLCPTMHVNVHEYWRLVSLFNGDAAAIPWDIRQHYSYYCRSIVELGWVLMSR